MISIIRDILLAYDYKLEEFSNGKKNFLLAMNNGGKSNYIIANLLSQNEIVTNDLAEEIFEKLASCKEWKPDMMKNTILLFLKEDNLENTNIGTAFDSQEIEENKFLFKKHVLISNSLEVKEFKEKFKASKIVKIKDFCSKSITDAHEFKTFKEGKSLYSWYNLLIKLSVKMPFMEMETGINEYIDVSEKINAAIKKKDLDLIKAFSLDLSESDSVTSFEAKIKKMVKDENA